MRNFSQQEIVIKPNTILAKLVAVREVGCSNDQQCKSPALCQATSVLDQESVSSLGVDIDDGNLTQAEKEQVQDLLLNNKDVFSKDPQDLGFTQTVEHEIPLVESVPFRMPYRRIPAGQFQEVRQHLDDLKQSGVIQPSQSPYASPIVIVRKKDGKIRLCVDYRQLNSRTVRDAYPLPRIDEALDALGKAKYFSCLDLTSGYHQVKMAAKDQQKTAFTSPMGLYEFTRMPFGLVNAPATFQRLMATVFGDMNFESLLIYLDDIIIFSSTIEEHVERLRKVFHRLREHGLKLKPSKCQLFKSSVKYLGHVVSEEGITTDPAKTAALKDWPIPKCKKDVRSFLGMTGYYRRFVFQYAKIAAPLFALTGGKRGSKEPPFVWSAECQSAFDTLVQKLTTAPILAYADYECPFLVQTDASGHGLGAVLAQVQDGKERAIAYASRTLTSSESKYPAHKLEFKALHWAATVKFKDYLYGQKITAVTDNNPLTYVLKKAKLDAHSQRWVSDLSMYDLDIVYRPGKVNTNADALSRITREEVTQIFDQTEKKGVESKDIDTSDVAILNLQFDEANSSSASDLVTTASSSTSGDEQPSGDERARTEHHSNTMTKCTQPNVSLPRLQQDDDAIGRVLQLKSLPHKPSDRQLRKEPRVVRRLVRSWDNLEVRGDLLFFRKESELKNRYLMVLPRMKRREVLRHLHDTMGHLGYNKTLQLVKERYFWPGMQTEVRRYIGRCKRCTLRKRPDGKRHAGLQNIRSTRPLELVCIDFLSLEKSKGGCENVLVITDHYTRYAQAYPTKDQKATTVAKVLWQKYIVHYGIPERIHSDQGKCFESAVVKELCQLLGIKKTKTTPYHPQGNGMTERFNRTLLSMMGTLEPYEKNNWAMHAEALTHAYNCTQHESTGYTPYYLMFARNPKLPVDLLLPTQEEPDDQVQDQDYPVYVRKLKQHMRHVYREVEATAEKSRAKQKSGYDQKVHESVLTSGDIVLVANKSLRGKSKLKDKWEENPYIVIRKLQDLPVYVVKKVGSTKTRSLHRNMLVTCPFEVTLSSKEDTSDANPDHLSSGDDVPPPPPGLHDAHRDDQTSEDDVLPPPLGFRNDQLPSDDDSATSNAWKAVAPSSSSSSSDDESLAGDGEDSAHSDASHQEFYHRLRRIVKPPIRFGEWQ